MSGVQPYRDCTPGPNPLDPPSSPLDVGTEDAATGEDDRILQPAADHDMSVFEQTTQIAGVIPALLVLAATNPAVVM